MRPLDRDTHNPQSCIYGQSSKKSSNDSSHRVGIIGNHHSLNAFEEASGVVRD